MATRTITLSASGWTQEISRLYYDDVSARFYRDSDLTSEVWEIPLPVRELYTFEGFWNSSSSSAADEWIDRDGHISRDWHPTANATIYIHQEQTAYKITVNTQGGTAESDVYYIGRPDGGVYPHWIIESYIPMDYLPVPTKTGYSFAGYYTSTSGGTQYVAADGEILDALKNRTAATTIYAHWTANTYTLHFDYGPGTGTVFSKPVTFDQPIGALPTGTWNEGSFDHWVYGGSQAVDADTVYTTASDTTVVARWNSYFGRLTDYFGLDTGDSPLMLVKSESGATRSIVETAGTTGSGSSLKNGRLAIQTANSAVGAFLQGPILTNPVCTYRIRRPGDVVIQLGKAFGMATITGTGSSSNPYRVVRSGYMLIAAEYSTSPDGEPLLVVKGSANEGYTWSGSYMRAGLTDAVNQWNVTIRVSPDHVAQDPFGAVNGGGELTECKTLITCDPVVLMEDGHPCASDVVHGKIIVTGTTCAYHGESAPEASTPFIEINGNPSGESDVDYTSYSFSMERSL